MSLQGHDNHPNLTKNQALVFDALQGAEGPLTAYAILDLLRSEGMRAPLQVYRALEKLVGFGIVHRLESLNAFVACKHPNCAAHASSAFAICEACGKVEEFSPKESMAMLNVWADENNFLAERVIVELRGKCQECRSG